MYIRELNTTTGTITITMRDEELRTVTNLLCKARNEIDFTARELEVNASLFTAITILHDGMIPEFERDHINELYQKAKEKRSDK